MSRARQGDEDRPRHRGGRADRPPIDRKAVEATAALVKDAVDRGATVRAGGSAIDGPGTFFEPTVITEVAAGSDILREEIFGPVLAIATFDTEDDAVRLGERHRVRTRLVCLHAGPRPRTPHDRPAGDRDDGPERRRRLECRCTVRRRPAVRIGPRGRARGHPRVPVHQVHADPGLPTLPAPIGNEQPMTGHAVTNPATGKARHLPDRPMPRSRRRSPSPTGRSARSGAPPPPPSGRRC